jgi:dTDP-4-dehydrorhamnose 3,5-epimerase
MDEIYIEGVILTPLNKICHPKGDILHGMKRGDEGFSGFGEAYFSTINDGEIKGWNKHKMMTLNLVVPLGSVTFVIYDDRDSISKKGKYFTVELSPDKYHRLTIPPGLWLAFKGKNKTTNLILNIADMEHDSEEIEKLGLYSIPFNWEAV